MISPRARSKVAEPSGREERPEGAPEGPVSGGVRRLARRRGYGPLLGILLAATAAAEDEAPGAVERRDPVVHGAEAALAGAAGGAYRIGPRDLLAIQVFEVPELNVERRVGESGTVELPLIGAVEAGGLTERELADRIRAVLEARYVQRASVAVQLKEFRSKPISIIGAVKSPGPLPLSGTFTLLEALSAAGGLTDDHGTVVHVLRPVEDGTTRKTTIDLERLLQKGDPEVNIAVAAGDLINVPGTYEVTISCLGEVQRGGALVFKSTERITLLAAIARAGGLTERASRKILIKREGPDGKSESRVVDYKRIVSGKDPDVELQQDDIVLVRQSFF